VFPAGACQKSPQPAKPASAAITRIPLSIDRQLRRRAGTPKKASKASTAPPPSHFLPLPRGLGRSSWAVVAAVVATVAVTVPLVEVELKATVVGDSEQVGASTAPEGELVSAQVSEAVPV
jgi:hypothetical protein